jgi:gas vesicle protein
MRDNTKILGALLLGASAGVVLGLLFAPGKGTDLRKKIKNNAADLIDDLEKKIYEGKETLADITDKVMGRAEEIKSKFEEESEAFKNGEGRKHKYSNT